MDAKTVWRTAVLSGALAAAGCSAESGAPANEDGTGGGALTGGTGGLGGGTGGASGGAPTSGGAPASGGAPGVSETEACVRYLEGWCKQRVRCGAFRDMSDCMEYGLQCPDLYFGPGSERTVDGMLACADDWEQLPCASNITPACAVGGTRAAGEPCINASQCLGGACATVLDGCGECMPFAAVGEACSIDVVWCDQTSVCGTAGVCELEGELPPDPPPVVPTEQFSLVGEPCDGTAPPCHQAATCVDGTCVAMGTDGVFPMRCLM